MKMNKPYKSIRVGSKVVRILEVVENKEYKVQLFNTANTGTGKTCICDSKETAEFFYSLAKESILNSCQTMF